MPKKITALLLAAVMLFSFSGCEFFDRLYDMHLPAKGGISSRAYRSRPKLAGNRMQYRDCGNAPKSCGRFARPC